MKNLSAILLSAVATIAVACVMLSGVKNSAVGDEKPSAAKPEQAAIERSRKKAQMLDNIYKQTIVLITDKYVNEEDDFPAGSAAIQLFKNISKTGSHKVRLIDATGKPSRPANVAEDDFEREGIKRLKGGAETYEKVVQVEGKPHLRVLTPVPVVMKKCIMCHEHYADAEKGEPIGAISYSIPIE